MACKEGVQGLDDSNNNKRTKDSYSPAVMKKQGSSYEPAYLTRKKSSRFLPNKPFKEHKYYKWILAGSFFLCFNAGYINGITLNTFHMQPSAHVTGMVARLSLTISARRYHEALVNAVSYLCFLAGAVISGILIQHQTFYLGRAYGRAFVVIATVQSAALVLESVWDGCVYFVWACALACGIQNGLTSKYSGNVVRTTHLTGSTTDLGIAIGHIIKGRKREDQWWRVMMHTNSLIGFFLGGMAGYVAFEHFNHLALLVSVCTTLLCAIVHTAYIAYHENLTLLSVLEANTDIKLHRNRVITAVPREGGEPRDGSVLIIREPRVAWAPAPFYHSASTRSLSSISSSNTTPFLPPPTTAAPPITTTPLPRPVSTDQRFAPPSRSRNCPISYRSSISDMSDLVAPPEEEEGSDADFEEHDKVAAEVMLSSEEEEGEGEGDVELESGGQWGTAGREGDDGGGEGGSDEELKYKVVVVEEEEEEGMAISRVILIEGWVQSQSPL